MRVYTVKEVSQILHLGKNQTYNLMKSKGFPSYRINRQYYVTDESLDKWLKNIINKTIFTGDR